MQANGAEYEISPVLEGKTLHHVVEEVRSASQDTNINTDKRDSDTGIRY